MGDRMIRLAADPGLRASMGAAGRQRAVSCFDVEKQVRELEDVLIRASRVARIPGRASAAGKSAFQSA